MKIIKFEINNYQGIKKLEIDEPPEVVVLIGPNGSGKSTVLKALNEILEFAYGYKTSVSSNLAITIDFSDELESIITSIDIMQNDYINWIRNYLNESRNFFDEIFNYLKTIFISNFKTKPIIAIRNGKFKTANNLKSRRNRYFENFISNNNFSKDKEQFVHYFIQYILATRSKGNENLPGVAILETEKENARNSILNISNTSTVEIERIRKLNDPSWRKNTLGSRLINLILRYSKKETSIDIDKRKINPVERLNRSLQTFIPHLSIVSPIGTDDKLKFNVRSKELSLDQLSSGEIAIIHFAIDYLEIELKNGVLIIDEPSAHLHHHLQKRILSFIKDLTTQEIDDRIVKPQLWISTHSPSIINSVRSDSIYFVDIERDENAVKKWEGDNGDKKTLLNLLGINQIFQTPILYLEGESDKDLLRRIFIKLNPTILNKWYIEYLEGIKNIDEVLKLQEEFKEKTKQIIILQQQLKQNHFIKDRDNDENQIKNDNTFIWKFYHIENLLFQEPWLEILKKTMKYRGKPNSNQNEILQKAIDEVFTESKLDISKEDLMKNNNWCKLLPGREILKRWNKHNSSVLKKEDAFGIVLHETKIIDEFPDELIRLSDWLNYKYKEWLNS